jgi:hypothetical protein
MPFYLYGTPEQQHIEHILFRAPNVQLCASNVELWLYPELPSEYLKAGVVAVMEDVHEHLLQPFGKSNEPNFFSAGKRFNITVYEDEMDYLRGPEAALAKGTLTLGPAIWRDYININREGDEGRPHSSLSTSYAMALSDGEEEKDGPHDSVGTESSPFLSDISSAIGEAMDEEISVSEAWRNTLYSVTSRAL